MHFWTIAAYPKDSQPVEVPQAPMQARRLKPQVTQAPAVEQNRIARAA